MILSHTCMHWCKLTGITFFIQYLMFCDVKKWESPFLSTWILRKSSSKIGQIAFVGWVIYMGPSYPHISVKYGNAPQWSKSTKPIAISTFFKNLFQFYLIINKLDSKKHPRKIPKPISGHNQFSWFQSWCWTVVQKKRSGEVLSLTTPRGAIMGEIWFLWVFRSLENAFATNAGLKILNDTDGRTKPQPQSRCTFIQISLCINLLTRNSIPSKIAFPRSHLHLELSQNFLP